MDGIQTQPQMPSPPDQSQQHGAHEADAMVHQHLHQQQQAHMPTPGAAEDAARVLAHMDQSLVDQVNAFAQHAQADGLTDPATAAAMAAAAAVPPGAPLQTPEGAPLVQRRAVRSASGVSREGAPEDDEERRAKRRLANREAARRMRSRRQQQAQTLSEEVASLRAANQQLLERLQVTSQQHQDALQQVGLLRNELLTLKQTLGGPWQQQSVCFPMRQMEGSASMAVSGTSNGMPANLMAVPPHLYSPAVSMKPPSLDMGPQEGSQALPEGADMQQQQQHEQHLQQHHHEQHVQHHHEQHLQHEQHHVQQQQHGAPLGDDGSQQAQQQQQQQMGAHMDGSAMAVSEAGQMAEWATAAAGVQSEPS